MTKNEFIKRQLEKEWPERFKEHTVNVLYAGTEVQCIEWRKPKSWNYGCRYMIQSQWLFCFGDIGEAVYQWSSPLTWEFLASLNFDYFLGKLRASPNVGKSWSEEVATENLKTYEAEIREHCGDDCDVDGLISSGSKDYAQEAGQIIYTKTGDSDLAGSVSGAGDVPDYMLMGQFVGLKLAIAARKAQQQ